MKISSKDFRVREGDKVDLRKWPTNVERVYKSKAKYKKLLKEHVAHLSALQELLYASNSHAVLLIFQAMDAAGKDGAIKHVMSGVNPQGCQVFSFKHPSAELRGMHDRHQGAEGGDVVAPVGRGVMDERTDHRPGGADEPKSRMHARRPRSSCVKT